MLAVSMMSMQSYSPTYANGVSESFPPGIPLLQSQELLHSSLLLLVAANTSQAWVGSDDVIDPLLGPHPGSLAYTLGSLLTLADTLTEWSDCRVRVRTGCVITPSPTHSDHHHTNLLTKHLASYR